MTVPVSNPASPLSATPLPDAVPCLNDLRAALEQLRGSGDATSLWPKLMASVDQLMIEHQGMALELLCLYEQLGIVFEITRKLAGVQNESDVLALFLASVRRSFEGRAVLVARRGPGRPSVDSPEGGPSGAEPPRRRPARPKRERPRKMARTDNRDGAWELHVQAGLGPGDATREAASQPAESLPLCEWLRVRIEEAYRRRAVIVEPCPTVETADRAGDGTTALLGDFTEVLIAPVISGDVLVCSLVFCRKPSMPEFRSGEMMLIESLTTFCGDLIRSHRLVRELREMSIAMVRALVNAVDQKDEYTCGHSLRVAYYATTLGQRLGLGEIDLQMLQWAALLHDVGKIGIRDNVLKKEGKLSAEEFGHIQEHPVRSHKVVQEVPQLLRALDGILHHHERYDGSGYPAGLKGEQIPFQARIIQIADVFDALTSNRSYRDAHDWRRALEILREEAGKTVDPRLQSVFDTLIRETLNDDPETWEEMVQRANRFMQGLDAPVDPGGIVQTAVPGARAAAPQGE